MARIYLVVDSAVLIVCLPFYAVTLPLMWVEEWLRQRRKVRVGLEVTHWPYHDLREDYVVVDVSRLDERLVGIRRRIWDMLGGKSAPPYTDAVDFIPIARFWVPNPFRLGEVFR